MSVFAFNNPQVQIDDLNTRLTGEESTTAQMGIKVAENDRFLPGTYTVATLPDPAINKFRYAACSDLGGGADIVLSDGTWWKQIRRGGILNITPAGSIPVQALVTPTYYNVLGTINLGMTFNIATQGMYPGYLLTIRRSNPLSIVLGLLGSLGIKLGNSASPIQTLNLTDQTSNLIYDGEKFIQL